MLNVKENSFLYINIIYLNRFCNPELKSYIFVFHSFCVFWSIILKYIIHRDWHSADLVTMAGRGRMKLCILQVLCMYFSVTVIFIFRSWSKTQKVAFYIYISWNISYSSFLKCNVEDKLLLLCPVNHLNVCTYQVICILQSPLPSNLCLFSFFANNCKLCHWSKLHVLQF